MIQSSTRIRSFDILKLFAIFFVLWGHCIQHLTTGDFVNKPMYVYIYSFHMPLFMMISGYFAWSSMSLSPIDFVKKKIVQLLLPCLIWGIFISGMVSLFHFLRWQTFSIVDIASFIVYSFWFLKSLFLCYMLAYLGKKIFPNAYWGIITIILSLMIDFLNLSIMYPCFLVGILLKSNDFLWKKKTRTIWIISLVIFIGLLCFWNKSFWDYRAFNFNSIFLEHENYPLIYLYK